MDRKDYYYFGRQRCAGPPPSCPANYEAEKRLQLEDQYKKRLQRMRYSPRTIKTYSFYFARFLEDFTGRSPEEITPEEINEYLLRLIRQRAISSSQQNQRINAIKFYFEKILGQAKEFYFLDRPRKERALPTILSIDEIRRLLGCTTNLKHKCILMTIYSAGLRRSELINLRISDIDSARNLIKIRNAKGKKDRYSILSKTLLQYLRKYYLEYRPGNWLFEGQGGRQYSATSIEKIMHIAARRAGILKHVTPHSLRHSFATHLMEQGTNQRHIQELLGHESSKTTEIYTRVASHQLTRIPNPLDDPGVDNRSVDNPHPNDQF